MNTRFSSTKCKQGFQAPNSILLNITVKPINYASTNQDPGFKKTQLWFLFGRSYNNSYLLNSINGDVMRLEFVPFDSHSQIASNYRFYIIFW